MSCTLMELEVAFDQLNQRYSDLLIERTRLREAIVDAMADLTPGIAPYSVLEAALRHA